jgi:5-methylthioadenosine/S-adenosylhomocysteine deaminase
MKMSTTCLIKDAQIISNAPVFGIRRGSVYIKDGKIARVIAKDAEKIPDADQVIYAEKMILIPGMINSHYHSYSNLLKGTVNNLPLEIWSLYTVAYGHSLDDEDLYSSVLLGAAEMIRHGITSCVDHFPHLSKADAALQAYVESGMRVAFAPMMQDIPDHHFLPVKLPDVIMRELDSVPPLSVEKMNDYYINLIKQWHGKEQRLQIMLGPNAPQRCSDEMLLLAQKLSERENLNIHTHLLETKLQCEWGKKRNRKGLVHHLHELGLLSPRLSVAHGVWLSKEERDLLVDAGVSLVHNPVSNMTLGSGLAPIVDYYKAFNTALGTDATNCGGSHNLFEAMRLALMLSRLHEPCYEKWLRAEDVWHMATLGGARVMGQSRKLGMISEGYEADLVLLNTTKTAWTPQEDLLSQLVHYETGQSVDSVMIQGRWVLQNGILKIFDEQKILEQVRERHASRMNRSSLALLVAEQLKPYFEKMYQNFYKKRGGIEDEC